MIISRVPHDYTKSPQALHDTYQIEKNRVDEKAARFARFLSSVAYPGYNSSYKLNPCEYHQQFSTKQKTKPLNE